MTTETHTTPTDLVDSTERLSIQNENNEDENTVQNDTSAEHTEENNYEEQSGTMHPLENEWSFWYDKRPAASRRVRGEQESYESNLREIGNFGTVSPVPILVFAYF